MREMKKADVENERIVDYVLMNSSLFCSKSYVQLPKLATFVNFLQFLASFSIHI